MHSTISLAILLPNEKLGVSDKRSYSNHQTFSLRVCGWLGMRPAQSHNVFVYNFVIHANYILANTIHNNILTQMLVKKSYGDKRRRHKQRNWQLQQLDREMDTSVATAQEAYERDYTDFLEDLEEDKQYRRNVNIYFSECNSVCRCRIRVSSIYLASLIIGTPARKWEKLSLISAREFPNISEFNL